MSEYHCDQHRQIKIKRDGEWVCPQCQPVNTHDVPDFLRGLFRGRGRNETTR